MKQEDVDKLWYKAMSQAMQQGELYTRYKFAELIVRECIQVAANQRNPSNLNYKPSERFVEELKKHFGVEGSFRNEILCEQN